MTTIQIGKLLGIYVWKGNRNIGSDMYFGPIVFWVLAEVNSPNYVERGITFSFGFVWDKNIYNKIKGVRQR